MIKSSYRMSEDVYRFGVNFFNLLFEISDNDEFEQWDTTLKLAMGWDGVLLGGCIYDRD